MCNSRCNCNREECCRNEGRNCDGRCESRCCDRGMGRCCNDDFEWMERKMREIEERRRAEDRCARQFRRCLRGCGCRDNRY